MKVDGSLKSLLQGVSQQPPRDRLAGQCTEQINLDANPIDGLVSRPPTDLVGLVGSSVGVRAWHDFQMQDGNQFLASFHEDGTVGVTDLNATVHDVTVTNGAAYIGATGLLRFYTDEDQNLTYLVNTGVVPAMSTDVMEYANSGVSKPHMAILQVLGGQYNRKYSISINGTVVAYYTPPNGATATDIDKIRTSHIATRLEAALEGTVSTTNPDGATSTLYTSGTALSGGYTVTRFEDVLLVQHASTAFDIVVSDDAGNVNFKSMSTQVPGVEDLPRIAPRGYVVRVATEVDPDKDLWLQFVTETTSTVGAGFGKAGYWSETVKPGIPYKLDPETMPHIMQYDPATGDFTVDEAPWADRLVGTDTSAPQPSFVGLQINDVSAFQSRLVFVAGKNLIASRTNDQTNFFKGSAAADADTDPIDINSTSEKGSLLASITAHNKDLVIFSRTGGQFVLFGRTALTSKNAALVLTTEYESQLDAAPVGAGKVVFFATAFGGWTGMREFFTTETTGDANDARPITDHVKKYIAGRATQIIASANQGMMIVRTDTDAETCYVYQYIWNEDQKVQSAWGKWTFSHEVAFMFYKDDRIYFVLRMGDDYYLHRMVLDVLDEMAVDFPVNLDSRFDVLECDTQFLLPFDWLYDQNLQVVQGADCPNPGMQVVIDTIEYSVELGGYVVTLLHDMLGGDVIVGVQYLRWYVPTMPLVKDQDGVVVSSGKLKVKTFVISCLNTGYIVARMISQWGNGPELAFNGRIVGSIESVVGETTLTDSDFHVPFRERTDRAEIVLYSRSYLPMGIVDIDWLGQYSKRGKRISTGG
jgi:hypothetical protein